MYEIELKISLDDKIIKEIVEKVNNNETINEPSN